MKIIFFLCVFFTLSFSGFSQENEIKEVLKTQVRCWNVGDLDCFMESYWKSDSLLFIGKNGVTQGWYQTYNNYNKNYPADAMGILNFDLLHINPLSEDAYFVVGKWNLVRQTGDVQGHFSLIFRKIEGRWLITADHSS
jgi:ketosteroid isomerase-like protein